MRASTSLAAVLSVALFASMPGVVGAAPSAAKRAHRPQRAHAAQPQQARDSGADAGGAEQKSEYSAEVLVLHATNSGRGIDERIGKMPELKKPPFSAYDSYEFLTKTRIPLKKDDPKTIKLPNGRVLQARLINVLPQDTLKISASINQPGGKDFLPLLEVKAKIGQAFIVAGQSYKSGILVLVIRAVK